MFKKNRLDLAFFLLIFIICLTIYILTLVPTVYLEDSGELIAAAHSLGVAHPPGYPVYVILGKFFSLLPFGSIAYNLNLMSAFFGALTCGILFLVIQQIIKIYHSQKKVTNHTHQAIHLSKESRYTFNQLISNYIIPASGALILAFSKTFWSQSIFAEVYTLNTFFFVLIILLLLKWAFKFQSFGVRQNGYLLWVSFLFGLSLTNHQMMILFLPAFLIFILVVDKKTFLNYRLVLGCLALFLVGLSVYLFMLLRSRYADPAFTWGDPYNWANLKAHILRKQYADFSPLSVHSLFNTSKLLYIHSLFSSFLAEFSLVGFFVSIIGFVWLWFKNKKIWLLLTLLFLTNSFLIIVLRKFGFSFLLDYAYRVYYLPAFIIIAVFLALTFYFLYNLVAKILSGSNPVIKNFLTGLIVLFVLAVPVSFVLNNYHTNNLSNFYLVDQYSKNILNSLEPGAKLFVLSDQPAFDSLCFSLMYQQVVNRLRPDVKIVNASNVRGIFYVPIGSYLKDENLDHKSYNQKKTRITEFLWEHNQSNSPLYLLHPLGLGMEDSLVTRSNGWVHQVYPDLETAQQDNQKYMDLKLSPLPNLENSNLNNDLFYRDLVSDYYYTRSAYYLETDQKEPHGQSLIRAIDFDVSSFSDNYNLFIQHRAIWQGKQPQAEPRLVPKEIIN